jgi:hypothetical protein
MGGEGSVKSSGSGQPTEQQAWLSGGSNVEFLDDFLEFGHFAMSWLVLFVAGQARQLFFFEAVRAGLSNVHVVAEYVQIPVNLPIFDLVNIQ